MDEIGNVIREIVGRGVAFVRHLRERFVDDGLELGHIVAFGKHELGRLLIEHFEEHRLDVLAGERFFVRQQAIEDDAGAENVRTAVDLRTTNLLGRHVVGGSEDRARLRLRRLLEPGDPEVHDLRFPTVVGDEDIRRLDVAVDDIVSVGVCESTASLRHDLQLLTERQRVAANTLLEV